MLVMHDVTRHPTRKVDKWGSGQFQAARGGMRIRGLTYRQVRARKSSHQSTARLFETPSRTKTPANTPEYSSGARASG